MLNSKACTYLFVIFCVSHLTFCDAIEERGGEYGQENIVDIVSSDHERNREDKEIMNESETKNPDDEGKLNHEDKPSLTNTHKPGLEHEIPEGNAGENFGKGSSNSESFQSLSSPNSINNLFGNSDVQDLRQILDAQLYAMVKQTVSKQHDTSPEAVDQEDMIDDTDDSESLETQFQSLTPDEIRANEYYQSAKEYLKLGEPPYKLAQGLKLLNMAIENGHSRAQLDLAWIKLLGTLVDQNITDAKILFEKFAEEGHGDAHMGLGFLYATGITVPPSQPRALVHYLFGAISGSHWAQMALAYRHAAGISVATECEKALMFYQGVATKVAEEASLTGGPLMYRARLVDETDNPTYNTGIVDRDLIDYYQLLADKGEVQAQVGLGQLHYQGGRGIPIDYEQALHYFMKAASAKSAIAYAFLGKMYMDGNDFVNQDNATAYKFFSEAAEQDNPMGYSGLGLMYLQGRHVAQDYAKAMTYFQKAANLGWVEGQYHLGMMYYKGLGVQRDYRTAHRYFSLASQSGSVLAYYYLGIMHASGYGIRRSCSIAVELFKSVAERGRWTVHMMDAYTDNQNNKKKEAFVKYALLAELGYEVAQSNAAYLLEKGNGFWEPDSKDAQSRALMYWSRAAGQDYSQAMIKLGDYYYYGLGTKVDYELAASHYRSAYESHNSPQAMFNLAYMHEQGIGMEQDFYLAKRFYDMAAETNNDAKVPVALAVFKLSIIFALRYIKEKHWVSWLMLFNFDKMFGPNWDLYIISALLCVLVAFFYQRPRRRVQVAPAPQT